MRKKYSLKCQMDNVVPENGPVTSGTFVSIYNLYCKPNYCPASDFPRITDHVRENLPLRIYIFASQYEDK